MTFTSRHMRSMMIGLVAILVIIAGFAYFVDLDAVVRQLEQANLADMLAASAMLLGGLYTYGLRWRVLLDRKPDRLFTFHVANIGHVLNIFIPLRLGEAARVVVMGQRRDVSYTEATSSFVLERVFEQVMRLAALLGAIILGASEAVSGGAIAGSVAFIITAAILMVWVVRNRERVLLSWPRYLARIPRLSQRRAHHILREWLNNLAAVSSPQLLLRVLFWSIVNWLFFWGFHYFALRALNLGFSAADVQRVTLLSLAVAPPSAPTQPGIYHLSIVTPLRLVGYDEALMTAYATVMHALQIIWMLPLGAWGLRQTGFTLRGVLSESQGREVAG